VTGRHARVVYDLATPAVEVGRSVRLTVFGVEKVGAIVGDLGSNLLVNVEGTQFLVRPERVVALDCPAHGADCEAWS
jgi:hypothetical protein